MRNRKTFEIKLQTRDPKTIKAYMNTLDSFEKYLSENKLSINSKNAEDLVQGYINWFNQNHSPNTVWNYYSRIKKYLRHLKIHIDEIELPAKNDKELYPLKIHDIHRIFEGMRPKNITLFLTQIQTGLRIGEAVQLRKKHFVLEYSRLLIRVPPQIAKFRKGRTAVVGKEAGSRIKLLLKKLDDQDLVFGSSDNVHSSEVSKEEVLRRQLVKVGLDMKYDDTGRYQINTHSFRAFFITHVSRHDPNLAKKLAGEKGYLLQYDRLTDEEYVENYLKFEDDLAVFDLTQRDQKMNFEQKQLEEKFEKQEKKINYLANELEKVKQWREISLKYNKKM